MAEAYVLKALRSRTRSLSLDNSQIKRLPASLGRLGFLTSLSAKNNSLEALPPEVVVLTGVSEPSAFNSTIAHTKIATQFLFFFCRKISLCSM